MKLSNKLRRIIYLSSTVLAAGGLLGVTTGLANADSTTNHQNTNPANTTKTTKAVQKNISPKTALTSVTTSTSNNNTANTSLKPTLSSNNASVSASASSSVTPQKVSNTLNKITSNSVQNAMQPSSNASSASNSVTVNPSLVGVYLPSFIRNYKHSLYIYHRTPRNIWNEFYASLPYRERESKEYIAYKESTDRYHVWNPEHTCYGRFQLNNSYYLHDDFSIVNQEKTADRYVAQRYGSWYNAAIFWHDNGSY